MSKHKFKGIRIGNIEYRVSRTIGKNPVEYEQIVCWYPNSYYGTEDKMRNDGWEFDADGDTHKDNMHVSASMFENPQHCYGIAEIEWNSEGDEYDVRSYGNRAFILSKEDEDDFKKVLDLIEKETYGEEY